jgi:hypothetical protein
MHYRQNQPERGTPLLNGTPRRIAAGRPLPPQRGLRGISRSTPSGSLIPPIPIRSKHIHPENPEKEDSEHFVNNYLHIIGNLNLLTQSQNSSFGCKDFDKKKGLVSKDCFAKLYGNQKKQTMDKDRDR